MRNYWLDRIQERKQRVFERLQDMVIAEMMTANEALRLFRHMERHEGQHRWIPAKINIVSPENF